MPRVTGVSTEDNAKNIESPLDLSGVPLMDIQNPTNSMATEDYHTMAAETASTGTAPESIFEGMQTIANIARTSADFDPLDPEGKGNKENFLTFTQHLNDSTVLSLLRSHTIYVKSKSRQSDKLINSFADAFNGIGEENKEAIVSAVTNLASAALSYSNQVERYSNFAQNILEVDAEGNVIFHLYYCQFQIESTERKGTIKFSSQYDVLQAVYKLTPGQWGMVREEFAEETKVSTEAWLSKFTTKPKMNADAKTPCLNKES